MSYLVINAEDALSSNKLVFIQLHLLVLDESFVGRGQHLKRINYRGQGRMDIMKRYYCHYFVILKEGTPPGKNISRMRSKYLTPLEKKLRYPKTIKNSLAWW